MIRKQQAICQKCGGENNKEGRTVLTQTVVYMCFADK